MTALEKIMDFADKNNGVVTISKAGFGDHLCKICFYDPEKNKVYAHVFDLDFLQAFGCKDTIIDVQIEKMISKMTRLQDGHNGG